MKTKEDFEVFKNIGTLNYYLYLEENNYIDYFNGITTLRITMDKDYNYKVLNLNFPDSNPTDFSSEMTIPVVENIIEDLKEQKPQMKNTMFKNRWEEIKTIVSANKAIIKNRVGA